MVDKDEKDEKEEMDETEEMEEAEEFSFIDECVEECEFNEHPASAESEGLADVFIRTEKRFRELCLEKIGALKATEAEILDYDPDDVECFKTVTVSSSDAGHSMLFDCSKGYEVKNLTDGGIEVRIYIDDFHLELWRERITEITLTEEELKKYPKYDEDDEDDEEGGEGEEGEGESESEES